MDIVILNQKVSLSILIPSDNHKPLTKHKCSLQIISKNSIYPYCT